MHVAGETERRISRLYNDVHAIDDQLSTVEKVQASHTKQLTTLNKTVAGIWTTQQQHGDKLNSLDTAFAVMSEQVNHRLDSHDKRFDAQGKQLETQDRKLDLIMKALNIGAD